MRYAESAVVNLPNFKSFHGSAKGELLSNQRLHSFHVLVNSALGFAAGSEITASKAVEVFGLGIAEALFSVLKLLNDGFHLEW